MISEIIPKYADGTDTEWITITPIEGVWTGSIKYRKIGNIVNIVITAISLVEDLTSSSLLVIAPSGTFPKPVNNVMVFGGNRDYLVEFVVNTNSGSLSLYKMASDSVYPKNSNASANITYFTK